MTTVPENALRSLLNRLRWDPRHCGADVTIVIRVRRNGTLAQEGIALADLTAVTAQGLHRRDGTFVPYHRVLEVRCNDVVLFHAGAGRHDDP